MAKAKRHIPDGLRSVTAHLVVPNALEMIEFYKKAFGAEVLSHAPGPAPGSTMHAAIRIGDAVVFLADDMSMGTAKAPAKLGGTSVSVMLFVEDCDAVFARAVAAGAKAAMPIGDQFWGDRYGQVIDPAGHLWELGTHKEDLTPEEMQERGRAFMEQMMKQGKP